MQHFPASQTNSQISHHLTARWLKFCPCQHWVKLCSPRTNEYKLTCMGKNGKRPVSSRKSHKTVKTLTGQVHKWALWEWPWSEHDHGHKTSCLYPIFSKWISEYISPSPEQCHCQWIPHLGSLQYQLGMFLLVGLHNCIELVSTMIDNNESDTDSQDFGYSWSELLSFHMSLLVVVKIHHGHQCQAIPVPSATCTGVVIFSKCSPLKWNLRCTGLRVLACYWSPAWWVMHSRNTNHYYRQLQS